LIELEEKHLQWFYNVKTVDRTMILINYYNYTLREGDPWNNPEHDDSARY
jgi:hypothetical protein